MKKIKTRIKEIGKLTIILDVEGKTISLPTEFIKKPKVGEVVVVTMTTEKEDAMSTKEVAHELIRIALRGE